MSNYSPKRFLYFICFFFENSVNLLLILILDIDECQDQLSNCMFRCHNMIGTFKCTCPRGFELSPDGRHCQGM